MEGFSDDAWRTWQNQLSYAKGPLAEKIEWTDDTLPSWRMEKVTFSAVYPDERVIAYLFIPRTVPPPWQPVIYVHPGFGRAVSSSQDGHNTLDLNFWDYVVKDGRVVVYPLFKGVFERGGGPDNVGFGPGLIGASRQRTSFGRSTIWRPAGISARTASVCSRSAGDLTGASWFAPSTSGSRRRCS